MLTVAWLWPSAYDRTCALASCASHPMAQPHRSGRAWAYLTVTDQATIPPATTSAPAATSVANMNRRRRLAGSTTSPSARSTATGRIVAQDQQTRTTESHCFVRCQAAYAGVLRSPTASHPRVMYTHGPLPWRIRVLSRFVHRDALTADGTGLSIWAFPRGIRPSASWSVAYAPGAFWVIRVIFDNFAVPDQVPRGVGSRDPQPRLRSSAR